MTDHELKQAIREVLEQYAGLGSPVSSLADDTDLFAAGMTSFSSVSVMLGLEERLAITFPESMLKRGTFQSIDSMADAITRTRSTAVAAE